MTRTVEALLLIATLVVCPYQCLGNAAAACALSKADHSCACCGHCDKSQPQDSSATPASPDQEPEAPREESRCDCVCRGAVVNRDEVSLESEIATGEIPAVLLSEIAELSGVRVPARIDDGPPRSTVAGRALRHVLQSLQV